jgi:hypothetical protein
VPAVQEAPSDWVASQSAAVQQFACGMQLAPQIFWPTGQVQMLSTQVAVAGHSLVPLQQSAAGATAFLT